MLQVLGGGASVFTSDGRAKVQDCWKGQEPELRTWMLKSTETQTDGLGSDHQKQIGLTDGRRWTYGPEAPSCSGVS